MAAMKPDPATTAALARLAAGFGEGDHPSPDRLLAYHLGELPAAAAGAIQDHLVGCEACGEALLDLATLADSEAPDPVPDIERAAAWRRLQPRLAASSPGGIASN